MPEIKFSSFTSPITPEWEHKRRVAFYRDLLRMAIDRRLGAISKPVEDCIRTISDLDRLDRCCMQMHILDQVDESVLLKILE